MKNADDPNVLKERRSFSLIECEAMREYLEGKALEGYLLKARQSNVFVFEKAEPCRRSYSVELFPKPALFHKHDPVPEVEEFIAYCAAAGWRHICTDGYASVFIAETENPVPVMTDERGKLSVIKKGVLREFCFSFGFVWLLNLLNAFLIGYMNFRISVVQNYVVFSYLLFFFILIAPFFPLVSRESWIIKQHRRIRGGEKLRFLNFSEQRRRQKKAACAIAIVLSGYIFLMTVIIWKNDSAQEAVFTALLMISCFSFFIVLAKLITEKKEQPRENSALF